MALANTLLRTHLMFVVLNNGADNLDAEALSNIWAGDCTSSIKKQALHRDQGLRWRWLAGGVFAQGYLATLNDCTQAKRDGTLTKACVVLAWCTDPLHDMLQ